MRGGGANDGFVTKLNSCRLGVSSTRPIWEVTTTELTHGVAIDPAGSAYVTGDTFSAGLPDNARRVRHDHRAGTFDVFVTKLNALGSGALVLNLPGRRQLGSTRRHRRGLEWQCPHHGLHVVHRFPDHAGRPRPTLDGGDDAFVIRLDAAGADLLHSTFLGGSGPTSRNGIGVDTERRRLRREAHRLPRFPTTPAPTTRPTTAGVRHLRQPLRPAKASPSSSPDCNVAVRPDRRPERRPCELQGRCAGSGPTEPGGSQSSSGLGPA